jgi:hypothetical protein
VGATLDMLTEWELWACANHFVRKHQADAPIIAAMRADELLSEGDLEGVRNYNAIVRRINQLLEEPDSGPH